MVAAEASMLHGADITTKIPDSYVAPPFSEPNAVVESRAAITDLPNELLLDIFNYLDGPNPTANQQLLQDEPTLDLINSHNTDLKNVSLVSNRWREAVLPLLFLHAQLKLPETEVEPKKVGLEFYQFLQFIRRYQLGKSVTTFTLCCYNRIFDEFYGRESIKIFQSFWTSLFEVLDPSEVLIIAPAQSLSFFTACPVFTEEAWCFDSLCHYLRLRRPTTLQGNGPSQTTQEGLMQDDTENTGSAAVSSSGTDASGELPYPADALEAATISAMSHRELVDSLQNLSKGTGRNLPGVPETLVFADAPVLFARPWSSILLNEGSFVRAYATYEFWERRPPSILPNLLGTTQTRPLLSPNIQDFSYISIFPMEPHFRHLTQNFPRIDRLFVQMVPRNEILQSSSRMIQVESSDLWLERNRCYAVLMRELFNAPPQGNFKHLKTFESGDAADKAAWEMAVEYVKRAGNGWKADGEGVFVKETPPEGGEAMDGPEGSAFEGALIRWAWNGTAVLPVSARPLYDRPLGPATG